MRVERAALQGRGPLVVRERAVGQPAPPEVGGAVDRLVRLLVGGRRRRPRPGERHEGLLAGAHGHAGPGAAALEAEAQVAREADGRVGPVGDADDGPVVVPGVGPGERVAAVAEHRLAVHGDDGRPADAVQRPHQHRLRLVVRRHPAEHRRALRRVAPAPDEQGVAHDQPAAVGPPRRLHHHGAGQVAATGRDHLVGGPDPEPARAAVEDGAEDGRRVGARHAHPLDVPARARSAR